MYSWATDDTAALKGARPWKGAQPLEFYRDDWHDPRRMYEHAERQLSDDDLRQKITIATDPEALADAVRDVEQMGATVVAIANVSGADPEAAIELYGEHVLPALKGARTR
jgi:coenzyme F420-dependent glucose-6-phosphate dehydrogenase